jgi:hypothetical protein
MALVELDIETPLADWGPRRMADSVLGVGMCGRYASTTPLRNTGLIFCDDECSQAEAQRAVLYKDRKSSLLVVG